MPLQRDEVQGYDFDRMVVDFTMRDADTIVVCAISTAAMDNLEDGRALKPEERVDQFLRLRDVIEDRASIKFLEEHSRLDRPLVLRSNDFSK